MEPCKYYKGISLRIGGDHRPPELGKPGTRLEAEEFFEAFEQAGEHKENRNGRNSRSEH